MYILGMESSCDETSAAVVAVEEGRFRILSNIVASQIETHRVYGGVVPEIASRAHIEAITGITREALSTAGVGVGELGAVAVTAFPGLIGALLVGVNFAKSLAFANSIPLVAVNHIKAHVAAAYLSHEALKPPFLALVVSGGHTSIFDVTDPTDFREIGSTRDDAAGEAFDKIGRVIGLPYPGGAALDRLAYEGDGKAIRLPSPALGGETLDFSFSGLKTAALNHINTCRQGGVEVARADLAASFTRAVVEGIAQKAEQALTLTGRKTLVLAGGVAANSHLRRRLGELVLLAGAQLVVPPVSLCGDNGAMVAAAGYFEFQSGRLADVSLNASALDHPEP
ncbi:MAG: tRNA (adenosine(37)-N6)-threonylcarbamoyltransferase complex transferase subunit TsaD [Ruminococcaceae bacterium]|nr:tRNA (adenosine(37)-N6)-threonylcarbamoyltransferase complex transferase subunit TsaD [Oscillospiraceae bacterium]